MAIERIGDSDIESQMRPDVNLQLTPEMDCQFESVLLQSMLKSTCIDQHFVNESGSCMSDVPVFGASLPQPSPIVRAFSSQNVPSHDTLIRPVGHLLPQGEGSKTDDFVKSIWPYAKQAASLIGLDPKILMAQAALETGWGKAIVKETDGSSSNNLFNIKAANTDQAVNIKTTEYIVDTPIKMMASFKKYSSVEHSFNDYISLIRGDRYKTALANAQDPKGYVSALQDAGYATDPDYANKILSIYHGDELQRILEQNGCLSS